MKIILYDSHPLRYFKKGLDKHNVKYQVKDPNIIYKDTDSPSYSFDKIPFEESDLAISFTCNIERINKQNKKGGRWLVLESNILPDPNCQFLSVGYDGLYGMADYCNKNSPGDRWKKHYGDSFLKPYQKNENGFVILMGQRIYHTSMSERIFDYSLKKFNLNMYDIFADITKFCIKNSIFFKFRPHPNSQDYYGKPIKDKILPLDEDLKNIKCAVVINSSVSANLMLKGIPTITLHKEAVTYSITKHKIKDILNPGYPDRKQLCYDLAYGQWSAKEMENGDCWEHIKQGLKNIKYTPKFKFDEHI